MLADEGGMSEKACNQVPADIDGQKITDNTTLPREPSRAHSSDSLELPASAQILFTATFDGIDRNTAAPFFGHVPVSEIGGSSQTLNDGPTAWLTMDKTCRT